MTINNGGAKMIGWTILLVLAMCAYSQAVPETIAIQGSLLAANETPLSGDRAYSVAFYDHATTGAQLGATTTGATTLSAAGRFTISLTPDASVLSASTVYYELGIDSAVTPDGSVDAGDIFADRVKVESVLFAQRAANADGHSLDADDGAPVDALYVNALGNVGVGLSDPRAPLHVRGNARNPRLLSEVWDGYGAFSKLNGAMSVFVSGDVAYVASYDARSLTLIDVSDPASPTLLSEVSNGDGGLINLDGARSVFVSGNVAYVASFNGNTLALIDVSYPARPMLLSQVWDGYGAFSKLNGPRSVFVSGNVAYVASQDDSSLTLIDVSDSTSPTLLSEVYDGDGTYDRLNACASVFVSGNVAYVASFWDHSLTLIDVSDPANPALLSEVWDEDGTFTKLSGPATVFVSDNVAYVVSQLDNSLTLIDVSDPINPAPISEVWDGDGSFSRLRGAESVFVSDNVAYVSSFLDHSLTLIDVSDHANPTLLSEAWDGDGTFSRLSGSNSVFVSGNVAYVASRGDSSLTLIDVGGALLGQTEVSGLKTGGLQAMDRAFFDNDVHIRGGVSATRGRIDGSLGVGGDLNVAGDIRSGGTTLIVPDYVFSGGYRLMSIEQLRAYIEANKHLPNVPSHKEIRANGLSHAAFQLRLLEKIEELTLYTIEQQRVIEEQREADEEQRKAVKALGDRIERLETRQKE